MRVFRSMRRGYRALTPQDKHLAFNFVLFLMYIVALALWSPASLWIAGFALLLYFTRLMVMFVSAIVKNSR